MNIARIALLALVAVCAWSADYDGGDMVPNSAHTHNLCVRDLITGMPYINYPIETRFVLTMVGIHYHNFDDPSRPLGRAEPMTDYTKGDGCFAQTYFSPEFDQRINLVITSPLIPGDIAVIDFRVYEPGMANMRDTVMHPIPNNMYGQPVYSVPLPNMYHWGFDGSVAFGIERRLRDIAITWNGITGKTLEITRLGSMLGGTNDDSWTPWVADYGDTHLKGLGFDVNISDADAAALGYAASSNGCYASQKPSGAYHIGCPEAAIDSRIIF